MIYVQKVTDGRTNKTCRSSTLTMSVLLFCFFFCVNLGSFFCCTKRKVITFVKKFPRVVLHRTIFTFSLLYMSSYICKKLSSCLEPSFPTDWRILGITRSIFQWNPPLIFYMSNLVNMFSVCRTHILQSDMVILHWTFWSVNLLKRKLQWSVVRLWSVNVTQSSGFNFSCYLGTREENKLIKLDVKFYYQPTVSSYRFLEFFTIPISSTHIINFVHLSNYSSHPRGGGKGS